MLSTIPQTESEAAPAVMSGDSRSITALLPIMGAVLIAFLVIGLALPVLPLHVHQGLGLSTFVVGLVTGSQFAAAMRRNIPTIFHQVGAMAHKVLYGANVAPGGAANSIPTRGELADCEAPRHHAAVLDPAARRRVIE
jgi:hypothetical protein